MKTFITILLVIFISITAIFDVSADDLTNMRYVSVYEAEEELRDTWELLRYVGTTDVEEITPGIKLRFEENNFFVELRYDEEIEGAWLLFEWQNEPHIIIKYLGQKSSDFYKVVFTAEGVNLVEPTISSDDPGDVYFVLRRDQG
jgi:hypothetical protein